MVVTQMIVGAALCGRPCARLIFANAGAATEGRPYNRLNHDHPG